jgi:pilus assembly protein Flp/PilA
MRNLVEKFTPEASVDADDAGLTMVEYAVAGSLVTLGAVLAFTNLGTAISTKIGEIVTELG